MLDVVTDCFGSGRRLCLVGRVGLEPGLGDLGEALADCFVRWQEALAGALHRGGRPTSAAEALAEDLLVAIQGAPILARARDEPAVLARTIARLRRAGA
ncbi:MAG TPA: hypothetical protein VGC67_16505 [Cellulomonas sp.]